MKLRNQAQTRSASFTLFCLMIYFIPACNTNTEKQRSAELINDTARQSTLFKQLVTLSGDSIAEKNMNDSLAFLILPLHVSCPDCREKVIDSILAHENNLDPQHFIIISADGGHKIINSYFRERGHNIPSIDGQVFLDSTNLASKFELYDEKPTFYYSYNRRVIKKSIGSSGNCPRRLEGAFCQKPRH